MPVALHPMQFGQLIVLFELLQVQFEHRQQFELQCQLLLVLHRQQFELQQLELLLQHVQLLFLQEQHLLLFLKLQYLLDRRQL